MKISTKFNLFVGFFFFFVFLAVFYSYCGGLTICYSFPFLNSIRGGPVSRAKIMMTSYIIDEKGESRDDARNAIYFYSKVHDNPHQTEERTRTRKPGDESNRSIKTGPSSHNPPSEITGKAVLDILRKSNTSLEEANRALFREEKVDKQVDRENPIMAKPIPTQSTPIMKTRGGLGLKYKPLRNNSSRKLPRKLRKKLSKNRINRLSKQDRVDKAQKKELNMAEVGMRMRGHGPGNESLTSKNRIKDLENASLNQREESMDSTNEGINPLDVIKYRSEAITHTKHQRNETERRSAKLSSKNLSTHRIKNMKNLTLDLENKERIDNKGSQKRTFLLEKGLLHENVKEKQVILNQNYIEFNQTKPSESKSELFSKESGVGRNGNSRSMTSSGPMKIIRKSKKKNVREGSGSDDGSGIRRYKSLSTGELIRSIRNIHNNQLKNALQSSLDKDEQQLKTNVNRIKTTLEQSYRPFNLTKVLKELVTVAEFDQGENFPRLKNEILLKRRDSWDKPLVREKRLGSMKRRNKQSEKTLVRVKRIEEDEGKGADP